MKPLTDTHILSDRTTSVTMGIGLVPSMRDMQRFIDFQEMVAEREPLLFKFNETDCLPHLSLLQMQNVDSDKVQGLKNLQCRDFVFSLPIDCEITGLSYIPQGWIFCDVTRSENLMELHKNAFEFARPYLSAGSTKDKDISHYTDHQKIMYRSYGYRFIGESFSPHVTLGRVDHKKTPSFEVVGGDAPAITGTVSFDRVVLFDVGPNGTCREILWQFSAS